MCFEESVLLVYGKREWDLANLFGSRYFLYYFELVIPKLKELPPSMEFFFLLLEHPVVLLSSIVYFLYYQIVSLTLTSHVCICELTSKNEAYISEEL